ncbi:hydroxymethylglutaryl-CoA lyase [Domibacillus sp. DTU_2020_1001157_1_SI_ALB_TIR_016]|uniref:hydroxymethylglutaryl-CoA lyase n=1 Tax=Domibacillus sp. DTU_2020_1001157_1_SI_ALB_TIR_016 TaxID=3077789 RepID=UPI0028EB0177|nr:hydroxymethylglutaryl-CoA lyase [Domibacillus sp. DTU_2020_1001157_1_SI_ALB_TIR_016]WNS78561.1 hydroxymethylglutaryl-CoA lyase [Domibacillus sp. DTU_2020_1001157_1_SI_ALB_TIR_016]
MIFPEKLKIRDVTLRDGLQNEPVFVETDQKINKIKSLIEAGFDRLEVTSFVHPKWVPAMQDADELGQNLPMSPGVEYEALVPNKRGLDRFLKSKIHNALFFLSASTEHNQANLNKTTDQSLEEIKELIHETNKEGRKTIGAISTAFVCPFAGVVPYSEVERVAEHLVNHGINELGLGDTIGKATPRQVYEYCSRLAEKFPDVPIGLHLHDTYGYGLANVMAGIQAGVHLVDVAQAGLGGCPYAPGSPGNIQASRVVAFLEQQNIKTGLDLEQLKKLDIEFPQLLSSAQVLTKTV